MPNLYEILADAQQGEAMTALGGEFGLTPQQTEAAVAALLPAVSMGLKQSTATPEGLGNLLALMAQQPELYAVYDDPRAAFSAKGRAAGNAALSMMFGSPDASRAIAAQAQNLSGVTSAILSRPSRRRGTVGSEGSVGTRFRPTRIPEVERSTHSHGFAWGWVESTPGGDVLGQVLRELEKAIREGRLKPVVIGPYEIDIPKQAGPAELRPTADPGRRHPGSNPA